MGARGAGNDMHWPRRASLPAGLRKEAANFAKAESRQQTARFDQSFRRSSSRDLTELSAPARARRPIPDLVEMSHLSSR